MPTVVIGMVGGLIVGMTSVGSGSLMIVMLLFLYPMLGANQLVGTDLTQAVPLTMAAALGALAFGHVEFSVTTSIIIGSVPAVLVGLIPLLARARPIHPTGHHLRDLRLRPEVRRARHHRPGLGAVRDAARDGGSRGWCSVGPGSARTTLTPRPRAPQRPTATLSRPNNAGRSRHQVHHFSSPPPSRPHHFERFTAANRTGPSGIKESLRKHVKERHSTAQLPGELDEALAGVSAEDDHNRRPGLRMSTRASLRTAPRTSQRGPALHLFYPQASHLFHPLREFQD